MFEIRAFLLMRLALVWASVVIMAGCSGPYDRLRDRYGVSGSVHGDELQSANVEIVERGRKGVIRIGDSIGVFVESDALTLKDDFRFVPGGGNVRIPASAVEACSMICFDDARKNVSLILAGVDMEVAIADNGRLAQWCWNNNIPAISSGSRRQWLYEKSIRVEGISGGPMTHEDFERTMKLACKGY